MRFYDIAITPPSGGKPSLTFQSHPQGQFNASALDIEFDLPVTQAGIPIGGQTITIHGISLDNLSQAQQFAGQNLTMKGGMQAGLPLNNPAQAGLIVQAQIFQSYANWVGTDMTLDFMLYAPIYTTDNPGNLVLDWQPGMSLATALKNTFSVAYPNIPVQMNIGDQYVPSTGRPHFAGTLDEMAQYVADTTQGLFKQTVHIALQTGQLLVYDTTTYKPSPVQLVFTDLIGQPTWVDKAVMQIKTVMRADLQIGSLLRMPQGMQNVPGFVTTTLASYPSSMKYQSTFQGQFRVIALRHLGHFRSSDAGDWCTVFNCVVEA